MLITIHTKTCLYCRLPGMIQVDADEWTAYKQGAFAQDAFPAMTASEREQIISGTHPKCWKLLMADLEEEETY